MTTQIKVEVDNRNSYLLLKEIQNYFSDFISNPMVSEENLLKIKEIIDELFSEERTGFKNFVVEFFEDGRNVDFDSLNEAYDMFCLEQTITIQQAPHWI
ncbi:MAG: hypothetical protein NC181_03380 [Clostridium sp.]|nr:hypothetical protein [Clostridium sp.]MCM1444332.1 hypothetical protein [Candidatus Amulumruptor caecigallinarius]